jgi:hypothetical protein
MKNILKALRAVFILLLATQTMNAQWVVTNGTSVGGVECFVELGTDLFAGTSNGGVFHSTNKGLNWKQTKTGLIDTNVLSLVFSGTTLFAGTAGVYTAHGVVGGGVYVSANNGESWTKASAGIDNNAILSLAVNGTTLFAGTYGNGAFLSTNNGASWTPAGALNASVRCFAMSGANIYAGTNGGVFLSTDNGGSWKALNAGLPTDPANLPVYALTVSGSSLFAGTYNGGVFSSVDGGAHWMSANTGLTNKYALSLAISGATVFAGTWGGGVFQSEDAGMHWQSLNTGLMNTNVFSLYVTGQQLFAGTSDNIYFNNQTGLIDGIQTTTNDAQGTVLEANYPNPFNPTTNISFSIASRSNVSLKIYDTSGKEVSEVVSGELDAGKYSRQWNAAGLPSGEYFYRLRAGTFAETKRLLVLK